MAMKPETREQFFQRFAPLVVSPSLECPIYYLHEVTSKVAFTRFVDNLLSSNGQAITCADLFNFFDTGEITWSGKPFMLTFDDGRLSQKINALPHLLRRGVRAVFAVMPNYQGDGRSIYMNDEDFQLLHGLGMEVISHSFNHPPNLPELRGINLGAWQAEIVQSQSVLSEIIQAPVDFFCFPYGRYDSPTLELVAQFYKGALSTLPGTRQYSNERFLFRRLVKNL